MRGFALDTVGFARLLRHGRELGLDDVQAAHVILNALGDDAAAAWPATHIGTYNRRRGNIDEAMSAYRTAVLMTAGDRDSLARYNALVNLEFTAALSGSATSCAKLQELERDAEALSLAFVRHKAAFFRGCLDVREGREEAGLATLTQAVTAQTELGHLSFLGRELLTQWDVAERLLPALAADSVVSATIDAIARHTDSRPALARAAALSEKHALAALAAAERWHTEPEQASLARSMLRLPFRRARERAAAALAPAPTSSDERVRLALDLTARESHAALEPGHRQDARQPHLPQARSDRSGRGGPALHSNSRDRLLTRVRGLGPAHAENRPWG